MKKKSITDLCGVESLDAFLLLEKTLDDQIKFKRIYVDIAGDLVAGILLGQILYWWGFDEYGNRRATIEHDGKIWIAKTREAWWDEIRITCYQFDRAAEILSKKGLIETGLWKFGLSPTKHIRPIDLNVIKAINSILDKVQNRIEGKSKIELRESPKSNLDKTSNGNEGKPQIHTIKQELLQELHTGGFQPPAPAPKLPLKKYAVEWAMWTDEHGNELFERAFGDKRVWDAADLQGFANLRDSGKNIHEITERFKIYLAEENPWYATRGYSFAEFAKNYNTFSPVIAARKANRNGHSRNGFNDRDRTEDVATNVAEAILMERQANAGY